MTISGNTFTIELIGGPAPTSGEIILTFKALAPK